MSKIYKALENARKERKKSEQIVTDGPMAEVSDLKTNGLGIEEEMISLYHSINSLLPDLPRKVIMFIGSREGEGTSSIVVEFARLLAMQLNKTVLILNADVHNPFRLLFDILPEHSFENVVKDDISIDKALCQIENLSIFAGNISAHSPSVPSVFDILRKDYFSEKMLQFDIILVDSPPATTSSDCMVISSMVDGTVLVLEAEKTRWPVAESVKDRVLKNGGKILGMILNKRRYHIPGFLYKRL